MAVHVTQARAGALQTSGGASAAAPDAPANGVKGEDDTEMQNGSEGAAQEPPAKKARTEVGVLLPRFPSGVRCSWLSRVQALLYGRARLCGAC